MTAAVRGPDYTWKDWLLIVAAVGVFLPLTLLVFGPALDGWLTANAPWVGP